VLTCPTCGRENPDDARFCNACAASLALLPARSEERKVVTVLFCDLVGFTARSDQADPEDVRAALRPYHSRVRAEVERFGGRVEKFVGDAVMAVFGAPVAHEDDADRAVRTGLRVLEAVGELNEQAAGLDLAVRIGVNTGEAVVALQARPEEGESMVAGDVVNTAARLQQAAPVGGVVVGEVTFRASRDTIEYEPLKPVRVKGKAEPVAVWRALRVRSPVGAEVERPLPTPFIGREDDLALLKQTYARTLRESSAQLVTVTGEPGVGKSRLLAEFKASLDDLDGEVSWRQGRCLPYGEGVTFWALGEIVKACAEILESDGPGEAADKLTLSLAALVPEASERDWIRGRLAPLVGVRTPEAAGSVEREESFTAWRRFLEALASERPLVLVFEDLHWGDASMLEFVEHLVDWSADVPLLVLCLARPELYERRPGWGGGKRNSTTIALSPLTTEETAQLISALLSQAMLPAETQRALIERAGGNPLYTEEFVRMLFDRRILERRGRIVRVASGVEIPVPDNVQALIAARLDTLPSGRKALLHDAAVVGKVFWSGAVSFIGGLQVKEVEEGLHELARKELVRPARSTSVKNQAEYSFWHLLVRDVAYGQIPRAARARKHRAAAEWIEETAGDRITDHAELLAHHDVQALELARAAGADGPIEELEDRARRSLVLAGDRAMQLDVGMAESYFRKALELFPADHPGRASALTKAAEAAFLSGRFAEAERDYERVIAGLRTRGDALGVGAAMVSLSFVHGFRGKTAQARELLRQVVDLLEGEPPGPELAKAYGHIARDMMLLGRSRDCLEWSEKALGLGEKLDIPAVTVMARQFRGTARCELGDLGGLGDLRQALQMSLDNGLTQETVRAHINLADWVWCIEGPGPALEVQRAGIRFGERRGITGPVLWTKGESLWTLFDLGTWDALLAIADELIAWDRAHGGSYFGVMALTYKARVLVWRGNLVDAAGLQEEFLARGRDIGDPQILTPALVTGALIEQRRGSKAAAVRLVRDFEEATRENAWFRARQLADATRITLWAGEVNLVRPLLEGADTTVRRDQLSVLTARALLAEAEGRLDEAEQLYREADRGWGEFGHILERGLAILGAGRCVVGLDKRAEAEAALKRARDDFLGLGAAPMVDETEALLGETTARRPGVG
jgi:class 3 adenylate cyclase/tetratricopeptide (TPR) repeat protein